MDRHAAEPTLEPHIPSGRQAVLHALGQGVRRSVARLPVTPASPRHPR